MGKRYKRRLERDGEENASSLIPDQDKVDYSIVMEYVGPPVSYEFPRVEPIEMNEDEIPTAEPVLDSSRRSAARDTTLVIEPIPLPMSHIARVMCSPNQRPRMSTSSESVVSVLQYDDFHSPSPSNSASPGSMHSQQHHSEGRRATVVASVLSMRKEQVGSERM
ncbi:hypothetical protein ACP275_13G072900 [Erythranthe tilingii]